MPLAPSLRQAPILKPATVRGKNVVLRDVEEHDADFIVSIRTDEGRSRYISATSSDVDDQRSWIRRYRERGNEAYFIICALEGDPLGTVRMYDPQGDAFRWGSWVTRPGAPGFASLESMLLVYWYGLMLGFNRARFEVRKPNRTVWGFNERNGARRVGENEFEYQYEICRPEMEAFLSRFRKQMPPEGVIWSAS